MTQTRHTYDWGKRTTTNPQHMPLNTLHHVYCDGTEYEVTKCRTGPDGYVEAMCYDESGEPAIDETGHAIKKRIIRGNVVVD